MSYSQRQESELEARQPDHPREGFIVPVSSSCTRSSARSSSPRTPLTGLRVLLPSHRKSFHSRKVLCVHLPAWRGCICGALWAADGGQRGRGCLGKDTQRRKTPAPSTAFLPSIHQLSRGSPIKWLFRAFNTTNQTCQHL